MTLRAGMARGVDARGDRVIEELAAVLGAAGARVVGALADDRRIERDAHRVLSCCAPPQRRP